MKKIEYKYLILVILTSVIYCPFYIQANSTYVQSDRVSEECSSVSAPFQQDGHKYTTYLVARYAGVNEVDAYTLTYYSQYPDIDSRYDAMSVGVKYYFIPWRWRWRSDIMGVLHSLHGGKLESIITRRDLLGGLISKSLNSNAPQYWKAGLMIHALGDTYSHTKNKYLSSDQEAYGTFVGHAIHLHHPDEIARPDVFPKYVAYVNRLFDILNVNGNGDKIRLEKYLTELKNLVCKTKANCSKAERNELSLKVIEFSIDEGSFSELWFDCIHSKVVPLKKKQVQRVLNEIKNEI